MTALEYPRFPEPDDIGRELAHRLRQQVLQSCEQEAAHTAEQFRPGPVRDYHDRIAACISFLRSTELEEAQAR